MNFGKYQFLYYSNLLKIFYTNDVFLSTAWSAGMAFSLAVRGKMYVRSDNIQTAARIKGAFLLGQVPWKQIHICVTLENAGEFIKRNLILF